MKYKLSHPDRIIGGEINLPASKSIANRLLIIRALCKDSFTINNLAPSDDTQVLNSVLNSLGKEETIDVGAAGTTMRFLTAFLTLQEGQRFTLTGSERMKKRPIGVLVEALRELGASISYMEEEGYPPLKIDGRFLDGGSLTINAGISSQYISALLLIAPVLKNGLKLTLEGEMVSRPYIEMTLSLMEAFGIDVEWKDNIIQINAQEYQEQEFTVEADWSAFGYFCTIASLAKQNKLVLNGLFKDSVQGDSVFPEYGSLLGLRFHFMKPYFHLIKGFEKVDQIEIDFTTFPDQAQTLIVWCAALGVSGNFKGLQTLKIKETDRLLALQNELSKLGVEFKEGKQGVWHLKGKIKQDQAVEISTYKDHRMAMAFAPLALVLPSLIIDDPMVVTKSYPMFWEDLKSLGFKIEDLN